MTEITKKNSGIMAQTHFAASSGTSTQECNSIIEFGCCCDNISRRCRPPSPLEPGIQQSLWGLCKEIELLSL